MIRASDYATISETRYKPFGQPRYVNGVSPTQHGFTGQQDDSYINLMWYGSRWYDPALGRFIQPDSIVPSVGEGDNSNAIGYVSNVNYAALTVDYHENQFLNQLNQENRKRLDGSMENLPSVPTNPLAFDRYAYAFNNSVRFTDPTGHDPRSEVEHLAALLAPMKTNASNRAWWSSAVTGVILQVGAVVVDTLACAATVGAGCVAAIVGGEVVVAAGAKIAYDLGGGNEAAKYQEIVDQINIVLTSKQYANADDIPMGWVATAEGQQKGWETFYVGDKYILVPPEWAEKIKAETRNDP